ncbi:hypothetical protein [Legionella feeleii]|uniref:Ankyrin repeat protein n=1 Tax=Legionella feeleii TaxID=453 RepID=A0A378KNP5_9GAMM|nr:hypothetical protein [Legionella feeleii]STX88390.1 Ankyrin repeat protein [Legionella feeleii]
MTSKIEYLQQLILKNNHEEISNLLHEKSDFVNEKDSRGRTALVYLMDKLGLKEITPEHFKKTALILLNKGADPTQLSSYLDGNTLLHHLVVSNKNGIHDKDIDNGFVAKSCLLR